MRFPDTIRGPTLDIVYADEFNFIANDEEEMESEWAEDESVWLPQSLITSCIDHKLEYINFEEIAKGVFYAGRDLGKHQDYNVLSIVKVEESSIKLIHLHQFPLKTALRQRHRLRENPMRPLKQNQQGACGHVRRRRLHCRGYG